MNLGNDVHVAIARNVLIRMMTYNDVHVAIARNVL
jgi:hypothetical protein